MCAVCGWRPATRRDHCDGCRMFLYRHGRDKTIGEVEIAWNRAVDRVSRIVLPQVGKVSYKGR